MLSARPLKGLETNKGQQYSGRHVYAMEPPNPLHGKARVNLPGESPLMLLSACGHCWKRMALSPSPLEGTPGNATRGSLPLSAPCVSSLGRSSCISSPREAAIVRNAASDEFWGASRKPSKLRVALGDPCTSQHPCIYALWRSGRSIFRSPPHAPFPDLAVSFATVIRPFYVTGLLDSDDLAACWAPLASLPPVLSPL